MRPRDLTKLTWKPEFSDFECRSGAAINVSWATGTVSLEFRGTFGQAFLIIPRKFFDRMVDYYLENCDEKWWRDFRNQETDDKMIFLGSRVGKGREREWQFWASRTICEPWDGKRGKNGEPKWKYVVSRTVSFRHNGDEDQTSFFVFRREDFDRIVGWYNSEIIVERKAA